MLIGAGQEADFFTEKLMPPGQGISNHRGVSMADVQFVTGIIDGCRNIKLLPFQLKNPLYRYYCNKKSSYPTWDERLVVPPNFIAASQQRTQQVLQNQLPRLISFIP